MPPIIAIKTSVMPPDIFLDSFPLSVTGTRPGDRSREKTIACREWLQQCEEAGHRIFAPAITHFEVVREMARLGANGKIARLNAFCAAEANRFVSITDGDLAQAALFWAQARRNGTLTAADTALDGDVILVAQVHLFMAKQTEPENYTVATTNTKHLNQFVRCAEWQDITP